MPQLDISTYTSQIFWLLIGFYVFYTMVHKSIIPSITDNVKRRENYVKEIAYHTNKIKAETSTLENIALDMYDQAIFSIERTEEEEKVRIRKTMAQLRKEMYDVYHQALSSQAQQLQDESESVIDDIQNNISCFIDLASQEIRNHFEVKDAC